MTNKLIDKIFRRADEKTRKKNDELFQNEVSSFFHFTKKIESLLVVDALLIAILPFLWNLNIPQSFESVAESTKVGIVVFLMFSVTLIALFSNTEKFKNNFFVTVFIGFLIVIIFGTVAWAGELIRPDYIQGWVIDWGLKGVLLISFSVATRNLYKKLQK